MAVSKEKIAALLKSYTWGRLSLFGGGANHEQQTPAAWLLVLPGGAKTSIGWAIVFWIAELYGLLNQHRTVEEDAVPLEPVLNRAS